MSDATLTTTAGLVEAFRAGLADGELLIQRCKACGNPQMYPRYRCTKCWSDDLGYVKAAGAGTLHSYTVIRAVPPRGFEDDVPYAVGVVKLDEGVQLLGRLWPSEESGDWDVYACDMRVTFAPADPEEIGRRPVAWFRPPAS
jgi:uncharacterized OB-fold protein